MKVALSKNRPKEMSKEEFEKSWNAIGYTLSTLYTTIQELESQASTVKTDDFSIPNHYALLAFEAGKRAAYKEILDFLPITAKQV